MTFQTSRFGVRAALAGAALAASTVCLAASGLHSHAGEALDIERPSMRSPIVEPASPHVVLVPVSEVVVVRDHGAASGPMSREEVRAQFDEAKSAGALPQAGEIAEPPSVLAARQDLIERHTDTLAIVTPADSVSVAELGSVWVDQD